MPVAQRVGGRVGLSEIVMFFSLLGGLQVFGVLGIVLGRVLFATAGAILDVSSDEIAASGGARAREGALSMLIRGSLA